MRKFTITAFAVCYAALLLFVSIERTGEWALKETDNLSHFHQIAHGSKGLSKGSKNDSHLGQTRLVETGFVVEMPREAAASPVPTQRLIHRPITHFYISAVTTLLSSRAPPFLT